MGNTRSATPERGTTREDGAATVEAGHTYAIAITARTASSTIGAGLLAGTTSARFDNVALTVDSDSGSSGSRGGAGARGGGGGGGGDGALTGAKLGALAPATVAGPARQRGGRLLVKVRCPKSVGRACRLSLLGLLSKRKPATAKRTTRVARGKSKRLVLKVKPRLKGRVIVRRRLLFKVRLRAGKANAVAYKQLRLIRR